MTTNSNNSNSWLNKLQNKAENFQRYFELSMQKTLTKEEDIAFIAQTLKQAESDSVLASILERIDDLVSSELPGEAKALEAYKKKQPWLAEYLVCSNPEFYLLLQKHLSNRQLYDGPLDGIYGEYTREAVEKFKLIEGIDEPELGPKTIEKILIPDPI